MDDSRSQTARSVLPACLFVMIAALTALACGESVNAPATATPRQSAGDAVSNEPPVPTPTTDAVDASINEQIMALECTPEDFVARQEANSAFIDMTRTSFEERLITYNEGVADNEPAIDRKLMEETARVFRDFPCIGRIRIAFDLPEGQRVVEATVADYEAFAGISFEALRADITAWRVFLGDLREDDYQAFVARFGVSD